MIKAEEKIKNVALKNCFAKAYHNNNRSYKVFNDIFAWKLIKEEECQIFRDKISQEIYDYQPMFTGTKEEALKWMMEKQVLPRILGRSAFCEKRLADAVNKGCNQYIVVAAGYDTFACRNFFPKLKVFEIDCKEMIEDKKRRLKAQRTATSKANYIECDFINHNLSKSILNSEYEATQRAFYSLLGIAQEITKEEWRKLINEIGKVVCEESVIVFDYAIIDEESKDSVEENSLQYTYCEMDAIMRESDFFIIENLDEEEMITEFFQLHNILNAKEKMQPPEGINYCLAMKYDTSSRFVPD